MVPVVVTGPLATKETIVNSKPFQDSTVGHLRYEQVATQLVVGAHHVGMNERMDYVRDQLAVSLNAFILTEDGGPVVEKTETTTFRFAAPVRPRWMPRVLWRRIPWRDVALDRSVTVSLQPKWKYPHAEQVAPLNEGLRYISTPKIDWRDSFDPSAPIAPR